MKELRILKPEKWPPLLKEISDPPKQLWIRGEDPNLDILWLCIIGARKHSSYGIQVCERIIKNLSGYNIGIVSGLAYGIDILAHKIALTHKLPIIAVPGSGLDDQVLYPRQHRNIAQEIISSGGCLISEFTPKQNPAPYLFQKRNRIMSGISEGILVIESKKKSGTQITARLALDYNREIMIVPGSIFSSLSEGPLSLLSHGAHPVTSAEDILEILNIEIKSKVNRSLEDLSPEEKDLYIYIMRAPINKDDLCKHINKPLHEINYLLTLLELKDLIFEQNGIICQK